MNRDLVAKIRKLLRLARTVGPEAAIAAERALALQEKHGLVVTLNDSARIPVPGAGEFWSDQILVAVARQHRCKILSSTTGDGAVIAGECTDAEEAVDLYRRLRSGLIVQCHGAWWRFIRDQDGWGEREYLSREDLERLSSRDDDDNEYEYDDGDRRRSVTVSDDGWAELVGEQLRNSPAFVAFVDKRAAKPPVIHDEHEIAVAWFRVYLDSAAISVIKRLAPPVKEQEPAQPMPDIMTPAQARQKQLTAQGENDEVLGYLKKLTEKYGKTKIQALQQNAQRDGVYAGREAYITPVSRKRLAADGSIPKPVPTRFTYLDFD